MVLEDYSQLFQQHFLKTNKALQKHNISNVGLSVKKIQLANI